MRVITAPLFCMAWLALGGCADTGYLAQTVRGHLALQAATRPVDAWLQDPATPPALRQQLQQAQRIRRYAVTALQLPDNASYSRYADLQRNAVVWNVVAAPEFSLQPRTWCFPVTGCIAYRGYFAEKDATAQADALRAQGLDVTVYGVPAYSTLGWTNWMGGDPLLNTFVNRGETELARLVFHELAHQQIYVKDDTRFNESFATAVERLGLAQWLTEPGREAQRSEHERQEKMRAQFRQLSVATRRELALAYEEKMPLAHDLYARSAIKNEAYVNFGKAYEVLRQSWGLKPGQPSGYDAWVAKANNASFAAVASYDEFVPGFEALFVAQSRDWQRFYDAVSRLAQLPQTERDIRLRVGAQALPLDWAGQSRAAVAMQRATNNF